MVKIFLAETNYTLLCLPKKLFKNSFLYGLKFLKVIQRKYASDQGDRMILLSVGIVHINFILPSLMFILSPFHFFFSLFFLGGG